MASSDPSLAESVCLALVCEGLQYGGAVAEVLAPGAELGRIWSLSRPLTYRAIDALIEQGLIVRAGTAPGRGRDRTVLEISRRGRTAAQRWLDSPVHHLRDVRTELLLKFAILERSDRSPALLATRQLAAFEPLIASIRADRSPDIVGRWRAEHAAAVERFLLAVAR